MSICFNITNKCYNLTLLAYQDYRHIDRQPKRKKFNHKKKRK